MKTERANALIFVLMRVWVPAGFAALARRDDGEKWEPQTIRFSP
jgi:hypothetical protein